jgi:hypothetical protein
MSSYFFTSQQAATAAASSSATAPTVVAPPACPTPAASLASGKAELAAAATTPVKVAVSANALRAMGKRTAGSRKQKGKFDRCFSELGSSMPFRAKSLPSENIFRLNQVQVIPAWSTSSTIVETDNAYYFMVANLPQIGSFTNLFDQYRVTLLEAWLFPQVPTVPTTAGSSSGLFYTAVDLDDAGTVTTSQLQEYENVVISHGIDGHYHRWKPSVASNVYGGGFSSFLNQTSPWVDMASTNVQHYGLKMAVTPTSQAYAFDLIVRAHLEFRCVR